MDYSPKEAVCTSCSKTSINPHCIDHDLTEISYSYREWFRLREFWNKTLTLQTLIHAHSNQFECIISEQEQNTYRDYASELQNTNVRIKILEQNAAMAREMIRNARYRLNAIETENEELRNKIKTDLDMTSVQNETSDQEKEISECRIKLRKLQNELIFRRRYMLKGISEIFFPKMTNNCLPIVYKKSCLCAKFDFIRGLHLPTVAARLGHNDVELCAAAGLLVHFLQTISEILLCPLKHVIFFNGSRSWLMTREKLETYNLFNPNSSKSNRNRFDQALYFICEIVVQLKTDCGIKTREFDRPIRHLRELLLSFIGVYKFAQTDIIFKFGKISNLSPAIYVTIDKGEEEEVPKKLAESNICNFLMPIPAYI